jgi:hypothetical protein
MPRLKERFNICVERNLVVRAKQILNEPPRVSLSRWINGQLRLLTDGKIPKSPPKE